MIKRLIFSFTISLIIITFIQPTISNAMITPERLGGKDRFEVATNISKKWEVSETVLIVNYNAFADALTAGPLAYKHNAPILLTQGNQLTQETKKELIRLNPSRVIVVGGEGSVSAMVIKAIESLGISQIERIAGKDRFEVSANVAKKFETWDTAIVANGLVFPDALSISPYAARNELPILLTQAGKLPSPIDQLIKSKGIKQSIIVGGEASVGRAVEGSLPTPKRIGGKNRFEVAAKVYQRLMPTEKVYVATGMTFADALTGSVLAANENASILLTHGQFLPKESLDIFKNNSVKDYAILGGPASVSENTVSDIEFHKKSNQPIFYLVPHADDEVLTFGVDILNQLKNNREVFLILFSKGADSVAREVINGHYDYESRLGHTNNTLVNCWWHGGYHSPENEHYQHGHIDLEEFGDIRVGDYISASAALGVREDHILTETLSSGMLTEGNIQGVIKKYLSQYPDAQFRSMSWFDGHPPHAAIGAALKGLEKSGEVNPLTTTYFVSIYTDRFAKKEIGLPLRSITIEEASSRNDLTDSINIYKKFDPSNGFYASGYHSVKSQFDSLQTNPYVKVHY
ncbi:Putative cell wall-binding protein [Mesobacillus persicus]|uniref:Putative cell wall-binding protein n=1 Tax=Mesobacillus persicus TaxID=930146 RepID=A0A1H8A4J5_9BACI|nr:cell wall-binding repeat-containing protein [Mesobacillus persicus]SEM65812.1 Putative cell wall-binding protein [Mesobacillus persicus]